jgi:hypothetical protein
MHLVSKKLINACAKNQLPLVKELMPNGGRM